MTPMISVTKMLSSLSKRIETMIATAGSGIRKLTSSSADCTGPIWIAEMIGKRIMMMDIETSMSDALRCQSSLGFLRARHSENLLTAKNTSPIASTTPRMILYGERSLPLDSA